MSPKTMTAATVNAVILALLDRGDRYGYEIIQQVRDLTDGEIEWAAGSLYPVLHRLQADGLVTSYWVDPPDDRKRKYYRITPKGRKALAVEKQQWLTLNRLLAALWGPQPGMAT